MYPSGLILPYDNSPRNQRESILFDTFRERFSTDILWMPAFAYSLKGLPLVTRPTLLYKTRNKTYIVDACDNPYYNFSNSYPWLVYIRIIGNTIPPFPELEEAIDINSEVPDGNVFSSLNDYRLLFHTLRRAFVDVNQPMKNIRVRNNMVYDGNGVKINSVIFTFTGYNGHDTIAGIINYGDKLFISHSGKMRLYGSVETRERTHH